MGHGREDEHDEETRRQGDAEKAGQWDFQCPVMFQRRYRLTAGVAGLSR